MAMIAAAHVMRVSGVPIFEVEAQGCGGSVSPSSSRRRTREPTGEPSRRRI